MTEQEALDSLMQDLIAGDTQETQEPQAVENKEPMQEPKAVEAQEPKSDLPDIKAMLENQSKMIEELKSKVETKGDKAQPEVTPEQLAQQEMIRKAQEELGITQLLQKQQQMEQEQQRAAQFKAEEAKFKQTHPDVNLEELAQWANGNGFQTVLGLGAQGWDLIARAMAAQSKPVAKPDPIIPSTSQSAEPSAFDRMKKGENVTAIEAGEDLLRTAGFYK